MSVPTEIKNLKRKLHMTNEKIKIFKELIKEHQQEHQEISHQLLIACKHINITKNRYYASGMHTAEYTYICNICDQEVSERTYSLNL